MHVSFSKIRVGSEYTRPQLAHLWKYRSFEAISRGVVTPAGTKFVILFITGEKQAFLPQYQDELRGKMLVIEGETNHASDDRLIRSPESGDEVHLFYRDKHHRAFGYKGQVYLVNFELRIRTPSRFEFTLDPAMAAAALSLQTEAQTHGSELDRFIPDEEGRAVIRRHLRYERSLKNRARALELHGTACLVCGFDFNTHYGREHARAYIEVHHIRSVTRGVRTPNPSSDLVPLCSNCHSMAHRRRGMCLGVAELKTLLQK